MFDLLKKLSETFGVSGTEDNIRNVIYHEIKNDVDDISVDALGNLIAIKRGTGKKIMVATHMDEIGIMATVIDEKGFVRFSNIGGVSPFHAIGQRVRFENGVTGAVYHEEKLEDIKKLKLSHLYVDIGATSKQEAEKKISIGDTACFVREVSAENDMIFGKAMDNRSGCAVAIKALQSLKETENTLYFVFTVQEELGLRGAKTAAFGIMPDIAIAIDVTATGDTPECEPMAVACGKGPAVKIKDNSVISHPKVRQWIVAAAKKLEMPIQFEILNFGGSDPGAIQLSGGGIPTGAISIPCRYLHSPVEGVNIKDIENASKLLKECLTSFK